MRKLRRLPWRIPKNHGNVQPQEQQPVKTAQRVEAAARIDLEREIELERQRERKRELLTAQPVAFTAGRYVYADRPSVPRSTEIRRKARLRALPVAG